MRSAAYVARRVSKDQIHLVFQGHLDILQIFKKILERNIEYI